ncbi:MAG: hypothetical protein ABI559_09405 [Chloroflexota bacterium]
MPARVACSLCLKPAIGGVPMTRLTGDPLKARSWVRDVRPLCLKCEHLLIEAGIFGLVPPDAGERWFAGHAHGVLADVPRNDSWRMMN